MAGRLFSAVAVAASLALLPGVASAAGGGGGGTGAGGGAGGTGAGTGGGAGGGVIVASNYSSQAQYARGMQALYAKDYYLAIFYFGKVIEVQPDSAAAENQLAFSYLQLKDVDTAFNHYENALAIDPNHKGVLEYQGEAYLVLGNLAKAEENLAVLANLCPGGCEELDELEEAIEKFKAGNYTGVVPRP